MAAGYERLVELIGKAVQDGNHPCREGKRPEGGAWTGGPQRGEGKETEHGVFDRVCRVGVPLGAARARRVGEAREQEDDAGPSEEGE